MKIVFLAGNFFPEYTGIAVHSTNIAKEFQRLGHNVKIFTSFPYYPKWIIEDRYKRKLFSRDNYEGMEVFRNWLYLPRNKKITTKSRIITELSFVIFQTLNLIRYAYMIKDADIIMVFSPFFLQGISAILLKKIWRIPYIFHIEDIQPDSAICTGFFNNIIIVRILIKMLKHLENFFYRESLVVSTLTNGMKRNIASKLGNVRKKVILLGYWVDFQKYFKSKTLRKLFRDRYNYSEDEILIGYAGNIGKKQNIHKLIEISEKIGSWTNKIGFIIAGEGAYKKETLMMVKNKKIKNIKLLSLQRGENYISFLNGVDLSFISQDKNANDIFIPSKLYPTLSCGSPIVCFANKNSELYSIIRDSNAGYAYQWNQVNEFIKEMLYLRGNKAKLNDKSVAARNYAISNFSKRAVFLPILHILDSIASLTHR